MDTFVCSDQHFGHSQILNFEPGRVTAMRIDGFDDHTEWLIECHNQTVGPDDTVLFLGDLAFKQYKLTSKAQKLYDIVKDMNQEDFKKNILDNDLTSIHEVIVFYK